MENKKVIANWNGEFSPLDELKVPVQDRSFFFGDAVYEVIRVYGARCFLMDGHMVRLKRSLESLSMVTDLKRLEARIYSTLEKSGVKDGYIYLQISRGSGPRAHGFPKPAIPTNELIYAQASGDPYSAYRASGISVISHEDIRWQRRDIKTVNLLGNCMAKNAAEEKGCQEAIFIESNGVITEACSSNVFIISKGVLYTHPVSHKILRGITRDFVLELCEELKLNVKEEMFKEEALRSADEVFITSTFSEVLPVVRLDGKAVGNGAPGAISMRLADLFKTKVKAFLAH